MNPATFGGKAGIKMLQHSIPYRGFPPFSFFISSFLFLIAAARIEVTIQSSTTWQLTTENVRRFGFSPLPANRNLSLPTQLTLDTQSFTTPLPLLPSSHFCNLAGTGWVICSGDGWTATEREPTNYGPARQVIEGPVAIVYGSQVIIAASILIILFC